MTEDRGRPMSRAAGNLAIIEALRRIDEGVARLVDTDRDHEQRLRVIEARTDNRDKLDSIARQLDTFDARLRTMERWRWVVSGAFLTGGTGLGIALSNLGTLSG